MGTHIPEEWPRIRNLPDNERGPFNDWLIGQTRPWIEGEPESEQDGYYAWDYKRWKTIRTVRIIHEP